MRDSYAKHSNNKIIRIILFVSLRELRQYSLGTGQD